MHRINGWLAALALASVPGAFSAAETFEVTVEAGDHDRKNSPVCVPIALPEALAEGASASLRGTGDEAIVGQVTAPGLLSQPAEAGEGEVARELHFLLPALGAGESATFEVEISPGESGAGDGGGFRWTEGPEADLLTLDGRPVLEYVHPTLDESSPEARERTYKPFHHLYNAEGGRRVTKGPGGLYTHHRGLFFAFNQVRYGEGRTADVWHARGKAFQSHEETVSAEAGPVLGRHVVRIDWHGQEGEVFATELRELTAHAVPGGHLIGFASRVETTGGPVELDGDPQHAGFHFRADDEVASKTAKQTYYLRPDGPGRPGETRNWDPKTGEGPVDLDWNAMSFVLGDHRYTVGYLDRADNPKEARFSERDYGRFGSYFEYELTESSPLEVEYRVWFQPGEMTVEEVEALDADFDEPVAATVKKD